jgi:hypothetical protein
VEKHHHEHQHRHPGRNATGVANWNYFQTFGVLVKRRHG